jgi:hypothetical protein
VDAHRWGGRPEITVNIHGGQGHGHVDGFLIVGGTPFDGISML